MYIIGLLPFLFLFFINRNLVRNESINSSDTKYKTDVTYLRNFEGGKGKFLLSEHSSENCFYICRIERFFVLFCFPLSFFLVIITIYPRYCFKLYLILEPVNNQKQKYQTNKVRTAHNRSWLLSQNVLQLVVVLEQSLLFVSTGA